MMDAATSPVPPARKRRKRLLTTRTHRPLPSAEGLWDRFDYKPLTGELIWKNPPKQKPFLLGRPAGCKSGSYVWISLSPSPSPYVAHRLIWRWLTSRDPGGLEVDHINSDGKDNRLANLRLADRYQQTQNSSKRTTYRGKPTRSRLKGVVIERRKNRVLIRAQIKINKRTIHLGIFPTEEAAHNAYCEAAKKHHGDFARTE
jgi:hypothetical protein